MFHDVHILVESRVHRFGTVSNTTCPTSSPHLTRPQSLFLRTCVSEISAQTAERLTRAALTAERRRRRLRSVLQHLRNQSFSAFEKLEEPGTGRFHRRLSQSASTRASGVCEMRFPRCVCWPLCVCVPGSSNGCPIHYILPYCWKC